MGLEGVTNPSQYCVLIMNNIDMIPTFDSIQLFANRLYECQRTWDVNIKAQKTPVMVIVDERQRALMENLYSQYDGNRPYIFGDKQQLDENILRTLNTEAPFIADKITQEKNNIWNEALTFLGINNIIEEKKERLTEDESQTNNELINLNLQSFLAPRQEACKNFNDLFNLTDTENEISVKVRSDLYNIIKTEQSSILQKEEGGEYGNIHDRT